MDITDQALALQGALQDWASGEGGKAFIASDLLHMWQVAYQNTQGLRAIICFEGLSMRGGDTYGAILCRADFHWKLALCRGRGFSAERSDSLVGTVVNARPFYTLIEEARDIIRAVQGLSVESPVDFRSIRPMPMNEGSLVDGYLIEFTLVADLPQIVAEPANYVSPVDEYPTSLASLLATCPTDPDSIPNNSTLPCTNQTPVSAVFTGQPNTTYDVTFSLAGIYEGKVYTGSTPVAGRVVSGGTPSADENNIIKLEVSSPAATYYLNSGRINALVATVEQSFTIPITSGATVTLTLDSVAPYRESTNFNELTIAGYTGLLPNWGQWIQLDATAFQAQ